MRFQLAMRGLGRKVLEPVRKICVIFPKLHFPYFAAHRSDRPTTTTSKEREATEPTQTPTTSALGDLHVKRKEYGNIFSSQQCSVIVHTNAPPDLAHRVDPTSGTIGTIGDDAHRDPILLDVLPVIIAHYYTTQSPPPRQGYREQIDTLAPTSL